MIEIYTDGSSRGNPGPGGYGVILQKGSRYKELSEGFRRTTNNRMELLAVIVGLEALKQKDSEVTIYSDSKYVINAVEKGWLANWVKINFKKKKNKDLWLKFYKLYQQHKIKFIWVRGHSGHKENERCDELARMSSYGKNLKIDQIYESEK